MAAYESYEQENMAYWTNRAPGYSAVHQSELGSSQRDVWRRTLLRHIEAYGVTDYVVGHYGRFDAMAARAVREAKKIHPEVRLSLLLPYHPAEREVWHPEQYDSLFYPPGMETVPRRAAIVRANRYMVDHSTHLIAYAWHPASNARELAEYAESREKKGSLIITLIKPND